MLECGNKPKLAEFALTGTVWVTCSGNKSSDVPAAVTDKVKLVDLHHRRAEALPTSLAVALEVGGMFDVLPTPSQPPKTLTSTKRNIHHHFSARLKQRSPTVRERTISAII